MTELHPIPVPASVWSLVGMDLIGPLKVTTRRNQFILTMTCYFSKWVEAFALPDKSADSIAREDIFPIAKKNIHHSQDKQKSSIRRGRAFLSLA